MDLAFRGYSLCGVVWYRALRVNNVLTIAMLISALSSQRQFYKPQWRVCKSKAGQGKDGHPISKNGQT